ncbi:hypothetical protein EYF80_063863 [Liparis tanakae]|uniref:Uncharacterized protein n=1 Tax=Liparis tanakae TaxID=230148 RepID=A0A4Z2EB76_9TELE|nr:hypothetical protein EYF80_063863 [Liparis tanakae]
MDFKCFTSQNPLCPGDHACSSHSNSPAPVYCGPISFWGRKKKKERKEGKERRRRHEEREELRAAARGLGGSPLCLFVSALLSGSSAG